MKRYISIYFLIFIFVLFVAGCSDDFIDENPTEQITIQDASSLNNKEGAEGFVTSIYSKYLDWGMSSFSWIGVSSITSDNADKGSAPGDSGTDKDVLDALTFTATTPAFQGQWEETYQVVNRANQALEFLPQLDSVDTDLRERLQGEAKFLRAMAYFKLVRMYGGVPLLDHVPEQGNEEDEKMTLERVSADEVYAFIESDLEDALEVLPEKGAYSEGDKGRASLGAAHALYAKVALYREDWEKAADEAGKVTGYAMADSYAENFRLAGEYNEESVFEIQGVGGEGNPGVQQYSMVQGARGNGGWGWGFNTPSQNLVDAFNAEGDEVRRDATIIFRDSELYDGRVVPATVDNPYYNYKAYSSEFSGDDLSNVNLKIIRYAEVLLIRAEALNELNQTGEAISLLNRVRNRVHLPDTKASSQSDVRKAIWKERRLELAMEHDRWFDFIRTGQAKAAMAADGKEFIDGKHELFPIPDSFVKEVEEAGGSIEQNPGY